MSDPVLLAIDPGPERSAWLTFADGMPRNWGIWANDDLLAALRGDDPDPDPMLAADRLVIEKVEAFGMAVGAEVFETVFWSGRFAEAAAPLPVDRVGRKAVKIALCGSMRAKDPNIRAAIIERYGTIEQAIGKKANPGPLYGIAADVWSALAVAITWAEAHP